MGTCLIKTLSLDMETICESVPRIHALPLISPVIQKNDEGLSIVQNILQTMGNMHPDFYHGYTMDYEPIVFQIKQI